MSEDIKEFELPEIGDITSAIAPLDYRPAFAQSKRTKERTKGVSDTKERHQRGQRHLVS